MTSYIPAKTPFSRVFLLEGRARPDHEPSFESCLMAGALDQSFGDLEKIECPSPDQFGQFEEIGQIQGAVERPTMPLTGRYAADLASTLWRLARLRCANDVHVNFGACTDPGDNNTFTKKIIFEQAYQSNYSTEDLGTLSSDGSAAVNESTDLSGKDAYEVLQLNVVERGADVVTNPLNDVVICSQPNCGDCDDEDNGCEKIYAVGSAVLGSPGTAPDVIWSVDKGVTLAADEITTMAPADEGVAIACLGLYVVVVDNTGDSIHYKLKSLINAGTAANWTEIATGFVAAGSPNDAWSVGNYMFVVGDTGYVYGTSNPVVGVDVLDAGTATTQGLNAVHAISKLFAVAVGDAGAVIYTKDQVTWQVVTAPAAVNLVAVWIKSESEWFAVGTAGQLYYTLDTGDSWTQITNLPVTLTAGYDIAFSTDSVAYLSGAVAGPAGVILRSYDGGYSWVSLPEGVGNLTANDAINAIAACEHDANFVVGVGLADDAADGVFLIGQD